VKSILAWRRELGLGSARSSIFGGRQGIETLIKMGVPLAGERDVSVDFGGGLEGTGGFRLFFGKFDFGPGLVCGVEVVRRRRVLREEEDACVRGRSDGRGAS
jgi:hypothetical protein